MFALHELIIFVNHTVFRIKCIIGLYIFLRTMTIGTTF